MYRSNLLCSLIKSSTGENVPEHGRLMNLYRASNAGVGFEPA